MNNFLSLEVVGRVGETQLQVGENLNYLILGFKMLFQAILNCLVCSRPIGFI